jgi:hypothetical protein
MHNQLNKLDDHTLNRILEFDRKGFVPSKKTKDIGQYLWESRTKLAMLEDIRADPSDFAKEQLGKKYDVEVVEATKTWKELFFDVFETEVLPAILLKPKQYQRQLIHQHMFAPGSEGTIIPFKRDGVKLWLPLLKNKEYDGEKEGYKVGHETVHGVRQQIEEGRLLNHHRDIFSYLFVEETIAYNFSSDGDIPSNQETQIYLKIFPPMVAALSIWPVLLMIPYTAPMSIGTYASAIATSIYFGCKTSNFYKKCAKEGLNPNYIFLRSNPHEFSKKKPIIDQLENGKNLRFQIMFEQLKNKSLSDGL